jgi:hypothetical protein
MDGQIATRKTQSGSNPATTPTLSGRFIAESMLTGSQAKRLVNSSKLCMPGGAGSHMVIFTSAPPSEDCWQHYL